MKKWVVLSFLVVFLFSTYSVAAANHHISRHREADGHKELQRKVGKPPKGKVVPGVEFFLKKHLDWVKGKRVGLITNPTGINRRLESDIDLLYKNKNVNLTALFGPEHGIRGDQEAGKYVESYIDERTGLPVYSLYGPTWKPTKEMLKNVDVLLFDIQDIGSNVYTYFYTLGFAMEAAAEQNKQLIVLDRPNAIGGTRVEGPLRDAGTVSFMGRFLLPVRHGMTVGELAEMWNHEYSLGIDLKVSKIKGWKRTMHFEDTGLPWVQTSPNIPTPDTANLYTGTELLDDTNLSTGLGTTKPFELVGAPWIDPVSLVEELNSRHIPGVRFRSAYFTPQFSQYKGELVGGVQIHIRDSHQINLVALGLNLLDAMRDQNPEKFNIKPSYDQLIGDPDVRKMIENDVPVDEIIASWQPKLQNWIQNVRNQYLMYGPYPKGAKPYKKQPVLGILPLDIEVAPGQSVDLTLHGVDENGKPLHLSSEDIKWEVKGGVGQIKEGVFTATKAGTGEIVATYNGLAAARDVKVAPNIINNIRLGVHSDYTRVVIDLNKTIDYDVQKKGNTLIVRVPYAQISGELNPEGGTVTVENSPVLSRITYGLEDNRTFVARMELKRDDVKYETPTFSNRIVVDVMHGD